MPMFRITRVAAIAAAALATLPAAASAHVTLQPNEAPAGEFTRLDVRVPNERDNARTKKVEVRFPPGFLFVSHEPVPGWDTEVKMEKLDEPIEVFGEERTEQVDTVTFSTDGEGIGPGEFKDFGLSVGLPDQPDSTLTFPALQTYSGGEVVRWIGAEESETPAPQVALTAAAPEEGAGAGGETDTQAATPAAAAASTDGGSDTLAVVALVVGALGLLIGLAGFMVARRARTPAAA